MAYSLERTVKDADLVPISGALVYVYDADSNLAKLVTSGDAPSVNPVTSDSLGYAAIFTAAQGIYTLKYFWGGRMRLVEAQAIAGAATLGNLIGDAAANAVAKAQAAISADVAAAEAAQTLAQTARDEAVAAADLAQVTVGGLVYNSWTALAAATGMVAGDSAVVFDDAGTHTDPVVGGTVGNVGVYVYSVSPAGWQRVAAGAGTVTSVGGTGTVNGLTLTGTVTDVGNLTLGGTLSGVSLTTQVSGTLPIANGGTGATDAATARSNLGAGTVTSVDGAGSVNGLTLTGTVTSSGSLTLGGGITSVGASATVDGFVIGYRSVPRSTTLTTAVAGDVAKCIAVSAGLTLPAATFAAGDAFSIYNDSAASVTITQGTNLTLRWAGTANTGNRTLGARGLATVWFNSASEAIISGAGVS